MSDTDKDKAGTEGTPPEGTDDGKASADEVEKWKALARKHEQRAKENADAAKRLSEIEDSNKSDLERLNDRAAAAEARAVEAERKALRYEVAAAKGVPAKLMRFLQGDDEAELTASADELLAAVKPDTGEENTGDDKSGGTSRPQERLRAGAANDAEPDETDPAKLAAAIPRG